MSDPMPLIISFRCSSLSCGWLAEESVSVTFVSLFLKIGTKSTDGSGRWQSLCILDYKVVWTLLDSGTESAFGPFVAPSPTDALNQC